MLKYHLTTYGCQMNQSDSERINAILQAHAFKLGQKNDSRILIFNLCSVRQSAVDRVWGQIQNIKKNIQLKNKGKPLVILTGCILPADRKKFKPRVDLILNITELANWPKIINARMAHKNPQAVAQLVKQCSDIDYFSIAPKRQSTFLAYVPIMTGCNNFCSYCAVPYTRGREQSRATKDILQEIRELVKQGYKEIILLGQNVNSYKSKYKNKTLNFTQLLKMIDKLAGNFWLNFISSHPKDLSPELIKCFKTCHHLTPYLHFALQSGSNKILKKMNRNYTAEHFLSLIKSVKKINSQIAVSTDIIVGFPGETQKDFQATAELMKKIKFDMAYIAQYSPRPGTPAAKLKDNVLKKTKKEREKKLSAILAKTALHNNQRLLNQTIDVLVQSKKKNYLIGQTNQFKHVKINMGNEQKIGVNNLIGKFTKVKIKTAEAWGLKGTLIK